MFEDAQFELELVERDAESEEYRTTYDLRENYLQAGERGHETLEERLTKGQLWDRFHTYHRFLLWKFPEEMANFYDRHTSDEIEVRPDEDTTGMKTARTLHEGDEECAHHTDRFEVSHTSPIWFVTETTRSEESHWVERDAVYIRVRGIERRLICVGCGEETVLGTAEVLEGEENIRHKDEMSEGERREFAENISTGAYYNKGTKSEHRKYLEGEFGE